MRQILNRYTKFAVAMLSFLVLLPAYLIAAVQIAVGAAACGLVCGLVVNLGTDYLNGQFQWTLPTSLLGVLWGSAMALYLLATGLYNALRRGEWPQ